jgi:hypothetical protein
MYKYAYITYQYNETYMMHFLFSVLRINASICLAHYLLILRRRYTRTNGTWYIACVLCQLAATRIGVEHVSPTPVPLQSSTVICAAPPEDEQAIFETCRGINS